MDKVLTIIGIIIAFLGLLFLWPETKKYIPFLPRPFIQISYQEQDNDISIMFENIGNAMANYITVEIKAKKGVFSIKEIYSVFELSASGKGGTMTVISGRNLLPQQKGVVRLISQSGLTSLEAPTVKSDSKYVFIGTFKISIGPVETVQN